MGADDTAPRPASVPVMAATTITPTRRAMVKLLCLALVAGTALAFVRGRDGSTWPVTRHPMFSHAQKRGASEGIEVALVANGAERVLPAEDGVFFRDFDAASVRALLRAIAAEEGGDYASARGRRALALVLDDRRRAAVARGEAVPSALRVYRVRREIGAVDPRPRVVDRTLLVEVEGESP